ncbi:M20 metallopeptidase family protein [Tamaricihabitans halophyticus]|nr:M20 family metallopeptidase [Tamaricihabitans halophyticus]
MGEARVRDLLAALSEQIDRELPGAIELRHELHRLPELSGAEARTRDRVLDALPAELARTSVADTGAVLRIGGPGRSVAVRAELDGLAVTERTELPWASTRPGVMHACGHDVHLAALVALCRAAHAVDVPVPLVGILQPREETYPSGARDIAESGVLTEHQVRATIGAHVQPLLPDGTVACVPGAVNASCDEFTITVRGSGGHAAYPQLTRDPVLGLTQVVVAAQSLVSRRMDPMATAVLSVTTLDAGAAPNVTPDIATARGTIRAMNETARQQLHAELAELVERVAEAHGCAGELAVHGGEPVLHNDPRITEGTARYLRAQDITVDEVLRSAGSDDFAYFSACYPSLMMFVGTHGGSERLHSATFAPDDEHIRQVARAMLAGYLGAASTLGMDG